MNPRGHLKAGGQGAEEGVQRASLLHVWSMDQQHLQPLRAGYEGRTPGPVWTCGIATCGFNETPGGAVCPSQAGNICLRGSIQTFQENIYHQKQINKQTKNKGNNHHCGAQHQPRTIANFSKYHPTVKTYKPFCSSAKIFDETKCSTLPVRSRSHLWL